MNTELFERKLSRTVDRVRVLLNEEKSHGFAREVPHQYEDKYLLAEQMTNVALASQLNCLSALGMTREAVAQLRDWSATSAISLRFRLEERCTYDREESREVENPTKHVDEFSVGGTVRSAWTSKVVTTVVEHFWRFEASYELLAVRGTGAEPGDRISILSRTGRDELKTSTKSPPHPQKAPEVLEVNVTWLIRHLEPGSASPSFRVDRDRRDCHTPVRNRDTIAAQEHFAKFRHWADSVLQWLKKLMEIQPDPTKKLDLSALQVDAALLTPVVPLLVDRAGAAPPALSDAQQPGILACLAASEGEGVEEVRRLRILASAALNALLAEEQRALSAHSRENLGKSFPSGSMVASLAEASLIVMLQHCSALCGRWAESIDYIEKMILEQLIAAIGKEVSPADFAEYMRFHYRKIFAAAYQPAPFCFAVRRSDRHSPEGGVSIEEQVVGRGGDSNMPMPIMTMCSRSTRAHPMEFPLSASASVRFEGDRFLHGWLSHQFSGQSGAKLSLVAKARQFSSMLVLVGRIASATTFQPKYAAIIQNKDELTIPLDLSTIPTPKEFKDAIESLSPEQQRFAKAFRAMQLESTLFGILVIHIKPQLERVLNLPDDSLTKEIKLTQDLMQLFIKYHIPSDLLSLDAAATTAAGGPDDKLAVVKAHVSAMQSMIEAAKQEEIQERQMEERYKNPLPDSDEESQEGEDRLGSSACNLDALCEDEGEDFACTRGGGGGSTGGMLKSFFGGGSRMMKKAMPESRLEAKEGRCREEARQATPAPKLKMSRSSAKPAAPGAPAAQASGAPKQPASRPREAAQEPAEQSSDSAVEVVDYTQLPKQMDKSFEELDTDGALRPTIISPGDTWTKKERKALLAGPSETVLGSEEQKSEKDAAFGLLDALTKSGALPISHASLHIVVAATHCFAKTVLGTVVEDNANPIEKVERSSLIMASTVHQQPAASLVQESQLARIQGASPRLFLAEEEAASAAAA